MKIVHGDGGLRVIGLAPGCEQIIGKKLCISDFDTQEFIHNSK